MQSNNAFFESFEIYLGYKLPENVKGILIKNQFDNEISLAELNDGIISELEALSNDKFLLGHRGLLLGLPKKIAAFTKRNEEFIEENVEENVNTDILNSPHVSFIMKQLVKCALQNANVEPKQRRYTDAIRNFGIYPYVMCGKASYEVLCNNIPLPKPTTIRTFILFVKSFIRLYYLCLTIQFP